MLKTYIFLVVLVSLATQFFNLFQMFVF